VGGGLGAISNTRLTLMNTPFLEDRSLVVSVHPFVGWMKTLPDFFCCCFLFDGLWVSSADDMDIANKSLWQSSCCHIEPVVFHNFFVFWVIGCCLEMNLLLLSFGYS